VTRQRERAKAERRGQTVARREAAKSHTRAPRAPGEEDPDIAGIIPGPQPPMFDDLEDEEPPEP
jgi:hypothetical protein